MTAPDHSTWEPQRVQAHTYALQCIAHRVRKFGFEPLLNRLDAASQRQLATMVHEPLASALIREAANG
jgi:hypothetical protein